MYYERVSFIISFSFLRICSCKSSIYTNVSREFEDLATYHGVQKLRSELSLAKTSWACKLENMIFYKNRFRPNTIVVEFCWRWRSESVFNLYSTGVKLFRAALFAALDGKTDRCAPYIAVIGHCFGQDSTHFFIWFLPSGYFEQLVNYSLLSRIVATLYSSVNIGQVKIMWQTICSIFAAWPN